MLRNPAVTKLVLLDVDDIEGGCVGESSAAYLRPLAETVSWARQYLSAPHHELGRGGPVCPFVGPSIERGRFQLAVWPGEPHDVDEVAAVLAAYRELFQDQVARDPAGAQYAAILVLFPDIPRARARELIEGAQTALKAGFVASGLMIGEFHDGPPDKAGLWNPGFRPLRSPWPMLAIRHMVPTDLLFLESDEPLVRQYFRIFGDRVPARFAARATVVAAKYGIPWGIGESMSFDRMLEVIGQWAVSTPDATALRDRHRSLTYAELTTAVRERAAALRARGVGEDTVVGLRLRPSVDTVVAILAVWTAGGAYLPLDPRLPDARLQVMIEDAAPALVVTDELPAGDPDDDLRSVDASALAYVLYTSGSTGQPKGVAVTRRSVANLVEHYTARLELGPDDRWLAVSTQAFDISVLEFVLPLVRGAAVVMADPALMADGQAMSRLLADQKITVLQGTPTMWRLLLAAGPLPPSVRIGLSGGETLPVDLANAITAYDIRLWNGYGPTETTVYSTGGWVPANTGAVGLGEPIANTLLYLLDDEGEQVGPGEIGHLFLGGDGLARGYLNQPGRTAERFVPDPFTPRSGARMYATGDLARRGSNGVLEFVGRSDHQVKLRGHRIELGEIEAALRADERVRDAVVVLDKGGDEPCLACYIVAAAAEPPGFAKAVRNRLIRLLPEYMVPAFVTELDRMPLTVSGKVDRAALPDPRARVVAGRAPEGLVEEVLIDLWRAGLGVPVLGADDDLLAAGSHSLLAMRMWAKVKEYFQVELPSSAALRARTVAGLALVLAEAEPTPGHLAAVARARRQIEAMTPGQITAALAVSGEAQ